MLISANYLPTLVLFIYFCNFNYFYFNCCCGAIPTKSNIHVYYKTQVEIDKLTESYVVDAKSLSTEDRVQRIKSIQESYSKCKEFADDKVQLAMQTYEMVSPTSEITKLVYL